MNSEGFRKLAKILWIGFTALLALTASGSALCQTAADEAAPLASSKTSLKGSELFEKVIENNHLRDIRLRQYYETRSYVVRNDKGKLHAMTEVQLHYIAPHSKSFETVCEEGSGVVRDLVFKKLIESEVETATGHSHRDSSITPANYDFQVTGAQDEDGRHYFIVQAIPKRRDKYLFEGTIWIDSEDFAIAKIAGRPARNPSFWIRRVEFVRQYQKIGDFWLPLKDESTTQVKIVGTKILTIEHFDYVVNRDETTTASPNPTSRGCQVTQAAQTNQ